MSNTSGLVGLPAELRNKIAEAVLYHGNDGYISPCPQLYTAHHVILVGGWRFTSAEIAWTQRPRPPVGRNKGRLVFLLSHTTSHRCTAECLYQPPLTRVCRRLRNDTLPMFYGQHHFHFELNQFPVLNKKGVYTGPGVGGWLRAVGDTNLRSIRNFSMAIPLEKIGYEVPKSLQFMFKQDQGRAGGEAHIRKVNFPSDRTPQDAAMNPLVYDGGGSREPFLAAIQANGLHVRALECIIASFERPDICFLRDYTSLQTHERAGKVAHQGKGLYGLDGSVEYEVEDARDYAMLLGDRNAKMERFEAAAWRRRRAARIE